MRKARPHRHPVPGDPTKILRVAENPELAALKGKTIVTTDGTTLLGADNKAGVAEIVAAAEVLVAHPEIAHGAIRIAFTPEPAVRVRVRAGSLWHREHSRAELEEMYARFRSARLADPRLPRWARASMPLIAAAQRRDAARLAGTGAFKPSPASSCVSNA